MKKAFVVVLFALCLLPWAAQSQTIYGADDKFTGDSHFYTKSRQPDLEGGSFWSQRYVFFGFHAYKTIDPPGNSIYIRVHTQTPDWVFIPAGQTLLIKLNGKEMIKLSGEGGAKTREILSHKEVSEIAYYEVGLAMLRRIGAADVVEFRVVGDNQNITGTWTKELIADAAYMAANLPELMGTAPVPPSPKEDGGVATPRRLGVDFSAVTVAIAHILKMPAPTGVIVVSVSPASVADKAGIKKGDVVLRYGEQVISSLSDLQAAVARTPAGAVVKIAIWRDAAESVLDAQF